MAKRIALIGGSGLSHGLSGFDVAEERPVDTVYGQTSAPLQFGQLAGSEMVFLPRHGGSHSLAPHKINYRANVSALQQSGVERIVAVNAVGGITKDMGPGVIAIPHQLIDYTWGRQSTFFDGEHNPLQHVDFSDPYTAELRQLLLAAGSNAGIQCVDYGVYGCTQGPRLETAAEIERMRRDGCDLVGMTAMPEAALAREMGIEYAAVCLVVNWGAGLQDEPITMAQIQHCLDQGLGQVGQLLHSFLSLVD
ncbi:MAG: S-methyl-5'-thioinosine phosphorylase [Candidatus Pelagadaptatus aseana]|uniref:S-methyl-5'-thioinosine phosphorylase n=1 Tax=Candidatus Pelagadaptatus aseana TaxID=3120508 RepID=UPI0039B1CD44